MNSHRQTTIFDALGQPSPYKERHQDDFYQTPAKLTEALVKRVNISGTILEPCTGHGAIENILSQLLPNTQIVGTDINIDAFGMPNDATSKRYWDVWRSHFQEYYGDKGIEWVVTNPPFKHAHLILPFALEYCTVGTAFLLRSTYSEPCGDRALWLIEHSDQQRYRFDINPRPQFRSKKGSDMTSVTWYVWLKNWSWKGKGMDSPFGFIIDWKNN